MQPVMVQGFQVEGLSVAGQETSIWLPRLRVAFDFGRCPLRLASQHTVLLSHGHLDHVAGLPLHAATRSMTGLPPATVALPPALLGNVQELLRVHERLGGEVLPCELLPLEAGCCHALSPSLLVRPFPTTHGVPSQGYVLYSVKSTLRPELQGLPGREISARKKAGEVVEMRSEVPEVAFTGDTTIHWALAGALSSSTETPSGVDSAGASSGTAGGEAAVAADLSRQQQQERGGDGSEGGACVSGAGQQGETEDAVGGYRLPLQVVRDALRAKLLITECTIVDDAVTPERAKENGHTHIADLVCHAGLFRDTGSILLTHFSARYKAKQVEEELERRLPPQLWAKCTPLLNGFS